MSEATYGPREYRGKSGPTTATETYAEYKALGTTFSAALHKSWGH